MELYDRIMIIEEERTRLFFHYGCTLALFPDMAAQATHLRSNTMIKIHVYISLAHCFGFDERQLLAYMRANGIFNVDEIYSRIYGTDMSIAVPHPHALDTEGVVQFLQRKFKKVKDDERELQGFWEDIKAIRDYVLSIIPITDTLADTNYLAYSNCVSCGIEPQRGQPHNLSLLAYQHNKGIPVPQCSTCSNANKPVNMLYALHLYHHYAHAVEHSMDILGGLR